MIQAAVSTLIAAAGYCRMSTGKQEESIQIQQELILKWAAENGVEIVRWYIDEAESGDAYRCQLEQMIEDGKRMAQFGLVVCRAQSRLSRYEPTEYFYYLHLLKRAGLKLATVKEGFIDGNQIASGVTTLIQAHADHKELFDKAELTTEGLINKVKNGEIFGHPYYGVRFEKIPGTENRRGVAKSRAIVVEEEATIVRELFDRVLEGWSIQSITRNLNQRRVPTHKGAKKWSTATVKNYLKNEAYIGTRVFGKRSAGKRVRVVGECLVPAPKDKTDTRVIRANRSQCLIVENVYPVIVQPDIFWAARKLLEGRASKPGRAYTYPLSGILVCGHCGSKVYGYTCSNRGRKYFYYRCGNYRDHMPMGTHTVDRECRFTLPLGTVEELIVDRLLDYLSDEAIAAKVEAMRKYLEERAGRSKELTTALAGQLASVDGKVTALEKRLLVLPEDMLTPVIAEIREQRAAREVILAQLTAERAASEVGETAIADQIRKIEERLRSLRQQVEVTVNLEHLRTVFEQLVEKVVVHPVALPEGKRKVAEVESYEVHFKGDLGSVQLKSHPGAIFNGQNESNVVFIEVLRG